MLSIEELSPIQPRINLRKEFPLALRSIFLRSFIWTLPFVLVVVVLTGFYNRLRLEFPSDSPLVSALDMVSMVIFGISLAFMLGKLIYEVFYFLFYHYQVELEHLVITKGLLFRARASVPMSKINDVSLQRGPLELLFNLYHLRIMTSSPMADLTSVEGLSPKNAISLQNRLLSLVETTTPEIKEREAEQIVPSPKPTGNDEALEFDVDDTKKEASG